MRTKHCNADPPATCEDSSDEDLKLVLEANPTEMKTNLRLSAGGFQKTRVVRSPELCPTTG